MKFTDFILTEKAHQLRWAIGKHADKAIRNYSNKDDFMIVWLRPDDVIKNTDPQMRVSPDDKVNHIGARMQRAINHFNEDGWMDPPIIGYDRYTHTEYKIAVDDGRHRIAALKKMGVKRFPAYILKDDLDLIKKVINVKLEE